MTKKTIQNLSYEIIGSAVEVHKILGPGLLESTYEKALIHELHLRGLQTESQQKVKIPYKGIFLDETLRYDILVENLIIIENKATSIFHPIFSAITLSYMFHLQKPKGILFNFHVQNLVKDGMKTFVNDFYSALPD